MLKPLGTPPKYKQIFESLRTALLRGDFRPGDRLPSESELVTEHGASRLTVNRALRELQLAGLIDRRVGSGSYVRQPEAQGLAFGLLIPELGQTEIFEPICRGMASAQIDRHVLVWGQSLSDAQTKQSAAEEICEQLIAKKVSGVFFAPLELTPDHDTVNRKIVTMFDRARIPVVLLDRDIVDFPHRSGYDLVGIDNRRAGHVITRHLIRQGCTRLVFVARPASAPTVDARIAGFKDALVLARLWRTTDHVWRIDPTDEASVRQCIESNKPDGVICANDLTAAQFMKTLQDVAADSLAFLRIAGIDDVKYASLLPVPLTTIQQPCNAIGGAAVAAMVQRLREPQMPERDILLDFRLIVRESCGARTRSARRAH